MTIALGFRATDGGVILAADTQITVANISKISQGKLRCGSRLWPVPTLENPNVAAWSFAVTGAGSADSIDHLQFKYSTAFMDGEEPMSVDSVNKYLETEMLDFYAKHINPRGDQAMDAAMIFAASDDRETGMWRTAGSIVTPCRDLALAGAGDTYAWNLLDKTYNPMNSVGAVLLAAYVIFHVKHFIDGCGEGTDIACINSRGAVMIDREDIGRLESLFREHSLIEANLLHEVFDYQVGFSGISHPRLTDRIRALRNRISDVVKPIRSSISGIH